MLNELYEVSTILRSSGVRPASWHRHFRPNPKPGRQSPAYFIQIARDGKVTDIQAVFDRDRVGSLRKWEVANGVSFPSFNVVPLYKVAGGKEEREGVGKFKKTLLSATPPDPAVRQEKLEQLVNKGEKLWTGSKSDRISKCLKTIPKQVAELLGEPPADCKAIGKLIHRTSQLDTETLFEHLAEFLRSAILRNPGCAKDFFDLLFFYPKDNKTKMKSATLILELADQSAFSYPANHERVQRWMNERFLASEVQDSGGSSKDAYAKPLAGWEETFPACRLSVLGNVILRAMSSESPCQHRYGLVDAQSYPVGSEVRKAMKSGLEWLAGSERKGRTWCDVSGGIAGSQLSCSPIPQHYVRTRLILPGYLWTLAMGKIQMARSFLHAPNASRLPSKALRMSRRKPRSECSSWRKLTRPEPKWSARVGIKLNASFRLHKSGKARVGMLLKYEFVGLGPQQLLHRSGRNL